MKEEEVHFRAAEEPKKEDMRSFAAPAALQQPFLSNLRRMLLYIADPVLKNRELTNFYLLF